MHLEDEKKKIMTSILSKSLRDSIKTIPLQTVIERVQELGSSAVRVCDL